MNLNNLEKGLIAGLGSMFLLAPLTQFHFYLGVIVTGLFIGFLSSKWQDLIDLEKQLQGKVK